MLKAFFWVLAFVEEPMYCHFMFKERTARKNPFLPYAPATPANSVVHMAELTWSISIQAYSQDTPLACLGCGGLVCS